MTIEISDTTLSSLINEIFKLEHSSLQRQPLSPSRHGNWIASRFYVIQQILQSSLGLSKLGDSTHTTIASRMFGGLLSAFALPAKLFSKRPTAILLLHERSKDLKDPYLEVIVRFFNLKSNGRHLLFLGDSRSLTSRQAFSGNVCSIECLKAIAKATSFVTSYFPVATWKREFLHTTFSHLSDDAALRVFRRRGIESLVLETAYGVMFSFMRPKILILTVSYTNIPLIRAAKSKGITVIECQHGLISEHHVGYGSYVYDTQSKPDYFALFGPSWTPPRISERSFVLGAGSMILPKAIPKLDHGHDFSILLISQKSINTQIAELIPLLLEKFPDNNIVVKLHPSEVSEHPYMGLGAKISLQESFYTLASRAEYVIGFYSTVIFELAQSGINVNVYPLPGAEMVGRSSSGIFHTDRDFSNLRKTLPFLGQEIPTYFSDPDTSSLEDILAEDLKL